MAHGIQDIDGRLVWVESAPLALQPGTVRIKVTASAVNRADLAQREGRYPPPPGASPILGLECSGRVVEVDRPDSRYSPGDQVVALLSGGGYAEEVVVPEGQVLPLPTGFSLLEGAALPEVFATAWLNLKLEGELAPGERVLVHAAGSGVGTAAVQLCAAWGNPVVGSLRSPAKAERVRQLGAESVVDTTEPEWWQAASARGKFDVILDCIGGDMLAPNVRLLNPLGRLISIGLMGGAEGSLPLGQLLTRRLTVKGSVLRSRSVEEKSAICADLEQHVWPLLAAGTVQPIIDSVYDITDAEAAHQKVASNQSSGKVLLKISED